MNSLTKNLPYISKRPVSEAFARSKVQAIYKIYKDHERGLEPDLTDLDKALDGMYEYYKSYIEWWGKSYGREEGRGTSLKLDYRKRLIEIIGALNSDSKRRKIIALDNAINQWHIDYPVIQHLSMAAGDEFEMEEDVKQFRQMIDDTEELLIRLGKLPKKSPYVKESSIDFPRQTLDRQIWDENNQLRPEIKQHIFSVLDRYPKVSLRSIAKGIRIVGSICTNQYQDFADVDTHVEPENKEDFTTDDQTEIMKWFNDNRDAINGWIGEHPIEVYLQFNPAQDLMSDGVYNIIEDKWVKGPKIVPVDYDPYEDFSGIADEIRNQVEKADELLGELRRDIVDYDVIKQAIERMSSKDRQQLQSKLQGKLQEIEDGIEDLYAKRKEWVDLRRKASKPETPEQAKEDIELARKWKDTNAIFKFINRYQYMKVIRALEGLIQDKEVSAQDVEVIKGLVGTV